MGSFGETHIFVMHKGFAIRRNGMRKINKKLISLALVAAMTGVIAGCGKSDQTSDNSSSMYTMKDGGQASAGASASTQVVVW